MTSWGVFQDLKPAGGRRQRRLRLVVEGVPDEIPRRQVIAALEGAGHHAAFSDAGVPWANHVVLPEGRWPALEAAGDRPTSTTWEALTEAQKARTITLRVPPAEYAQIALAAANAGADLYPWCRAQLLEASTP